MSNPTRGLQWEIIPRLGARLVQEGNRLHYLADRARPGQHHRQVQ